MSEIENTNIPAEEPLPEEKNLTIENELLHPFADNESTSQEDNPTENIKDLLFPDAEVVSNLPEKPVMVGGIIDPAIVSAVEVEEEKDEQCEMAMFPEYVSADRDSLVYTPEELLAIFEKMHSLPLNKYLEKIKVNRCLYFISIPSRQDQEAEEEVEWDTPDIQNDPEMDLSSNNTSLQNDQKRIHDIVSSLANGVEVFIPDDIRVAVMNIMFENNVHSHRIVPTERPITENDDLLELPEENTRKGPESSIMEMIQTTEVPRMEAPPASEPIAANDFEMMLLNSARGQPPMRGDHRERVEYDGYRERMMQYNPFYDRRMGGMPMHGVKTVSRTGKTVFSGPSEAAMRYGRGYMECRDVRGERVEIPGDMGMDREQMERRGRQMEMAMGRQAMRQPMRPQMERHSINRQSMDRNMERPQMDRNMERPQMDRNMERPQMDRNIERPQMDRNMERPQMERPMERNMERPMERNMERPQMERPQMERPQMERPMERNMERPMERPQMERPMERNMDRNMDPSMKRGMPMDRRMMDPNMPMDRRMMDRSGRVIDRPTERRMVDRSMQRGPSNDRRYQDMPMEQPQAMDPRMTMHPQAVPMARKMPPAPQNRQNMTPTPDDRQEPMNRFQNESNNIMFNGIPMQMMTMPMSLPMQMAPQYSFSTGMYAMQQPLSPAIQQVMPQMQPPVPMRMSMPGQMPATQFPGQQAVNSLGAHSLSTSKISAAAAPFIPASLREKNEAPKEEDA